MASELASGRDWSISEVVCHARPQDRPFEEQHGPTAIAVVVSGTFQYRSSNGDELMTPGSMLLGNPGECFCCRHGRPLYFVRVLAFVVCTDRAIGVALPCSAVASRAGDGASGDTGGSFSRRRRRAELGAGVHRRGAETRRAAGDLRSERGEPLRLSEVH